MERCPNCGAPTRPGAKFCTTCGYQLSDDTGDPVTANRGEDAAAGDGADTVAPGWTVSTAEATADDSLPPTDIALASDAAAEDGPIPPATDDPLATPATAAPDPAFAGYDPPPPEGDAAVAADDGPEAADQVLSSSWPNPDTASWSAGWGTPREQQAISAAATDPDPDDGEEAPSPWAGVAWGAQAEPAADPVALGPDSGATLPPAAPLVDGSEPTATDNDPTGEEADDPSSPPVDERDTPPLPNIADDPAARAAALVEELRALLPALTAAPELDAHAVAAVLEAALPTDADAAANDRGILRAALRAVRDRPRDIDAMLDLAVRADPLLALLDAYDAALAAIDRARAALRPDRDYGGLQRSGPNRSVATARTSSASGPARF